MKPILLRRLKTDVTLITSEKKEHVLFIKMTTEQEKVYKKFLKSTDVQNVLSGGTKCFGALQKLRLIVSHPFFLGDELGKVNDAEIENAVKKIKLSGKMIALASLLGAWRKQNRKVLIFTQTLPSLKMISGMCARHQLPCRIISGKTIFIIVLIILFFVIWCVIFFFFAVIISECSWVIPRRNNTKFCKRDEFHLPVMITE